MLQKDFRSTLHFHDYEVCQNVWATSNIAGHFYSSLADYKSPVKRQNNYMGAQE